MGITGIGTPGGTLRFLAIPTALCELQSTKPEAPARGCDTTLDGAVPPTADNSLNHQERLFDSLGPITPSQPKTIDSTAHFW